MNKQEDFIALYEQYSGMVYNLCINYLQNIEEAEEVSQDIFVKVHKNMNSFHQKSSYKTWIYRITINTCLDCIKAKKRQKRLTLFQSIFSKAEKELPLPDFNHPGVQLEHKEAVEELLKKINTLSENQKTALILKAIDGLSQKEIAEIMEISLKAVESLLSRGKTNLKKKMVLNEGLLV